MSGGGGDGVDDVHALNNLTEDDVVLREIVVLVHDEELGPVGVGTSVGHGDGATGVLASKRFVIETVAGSTGASASWVTTLDHETVDDTVEDGVIVEVILSKIDEVVDGDGGLLGIEGDDNVALVCFESGSVGFLGVDDDVWLREIGRGGSGCIHGLGGINC